MKLRRILLTFLAIVLAAAPTLRSASLDEQFRSPPPAYGPWVYWIWVNGNTTKAGIRADLEDMKRVGIRGAMLFEGSLYLPSGPVRYGSNAWHEHVQYAIATAAELGLEIVMMNCAGWATSGGPWNDVERSMKMIVWSEQAVPGGTPWHGRLPQPATQLDFYRDVAVLALPASPEQTPAITSTDASLRAAVFTDRNSATRAALRGPTTLTFDFGAPAERHWVEIERARSEHRESAEGLGQDEDLVPAGRIEASDDGVNFKLLRRFEESRVEFASRVVIDFPATRARFFRLTVEPRTPWTVAELSLTQFQRVAQLAEKTGLKTAPVPQPADWDRTLTGEYNAADVVDLTDRVAADGTLAWDPPPGHWTILRFGYTTSARRNHPSPEEGEGLEVDKFDAAALAHHFENALGRILREAGPQVGHSLAGVLSDSWEAGPQTWTAALPAEFERRRGYSLHRLLPALTGRMAGTAAETEAFLADYRRTLGELYAENYYGALQTLSRRHGLKLFAEAYGGVLDEARALERVDVPMVEFWNHNLYKGFDFAPSAAPLSGNPVVLAEAFTSRPPEWSGWREHPAALKTLGDAAYAAGVTGFVLHSYVHQPRTDLAPGFTHGRYGTQMGRLNSWWPLATGWTDYLRRCQLLLQQGRAVADVLQLREERLQSEYRVLPPVGVPGHQAHLLSVSQLDRVTVRDGLLQTSAGATYRLLELPASWTATTATLRRLLALRDAGAVLAGARPFAPATLPDAQAGRTAWDAAVAALWTGPKAPAPDAATALTRLSATPDFRVLAADEGADLRFAHRVSAEGDFYFLTNQSGRAIEARVDFRVGDRGPELWDATSGRIAPAPVFSAEAGRTALTLALAAGDSVFVVFRHARPAGWAQSVTRNGAALAIPSPAWLAADGRLAAREGGDYRVTLSDGSERSLHLAPPPAPVELRGAWKVSFAAPRHAPPARTLSALGSLTEQSDPAVKYFSGIASYETDFTIDAATLAPGRRVFLDLGEVHDLARLTLNGRPLTILWRAPFVVDISATVRAGANTLRVEVANRWVNRLIGDESLPADANYAAPDGTKDALADFPTWWNDAAAAARRERTAFPTWKFHSANSPLLPAGLVGPVRLRFAQDLDLPR